MTKWQRRMICMFNFVLLFWIVCYRHDSQDEKVDPWKSCWNELWSQVIGPENSISHGSHLCVNIEGRSTCSTTLTWPWPSSYDLHVHIRFAFLNRLLPIWLPGWKSRPLKIVFSRGRIYVSLLRVGKLVSLPWHDQVAASHDLHVQFLLTFLNRVLPIWLPGRRSRPLITVFSESRIYVSVLRASQIVALPWHDQVAASYDLHVPFRLTSLNRLLPPWLPSLSVTILGETTTLLLEPIAVLHCSWLTQANVVVSIGSSKLESRQRNFQSCTNCCGLCGFIKLLDSWMPKLDINVTSQWFFVWCTGKSSRTPKNFANLDVGIIFLGKNGEGFWHWNEMFGNRIFPYWYDRQSWTLWRSSISSWMS